MLYLHCCIPQINDLFLFLFGSVLHGLFVRACITATSESSTVQRKPQPARDEGPSTTDQRPPRPGDDCQAGPERMDMSLEEEEEEEDDEDLVMRRQLQRIHQQQQQQQHLYARSAGIMTPPIPGRSIMSPSSLMGHTIMASPSPGAQQEWIQLMPVSSNQGVQAVAGVQAAQAHAALAARQQQHQQQQMGLSGMVQVYPGLPMSHPLNQHMMQQQQQQQAQLLQAYPGGLQLSHPGLQLGGHHGGLQLAAHPQGLQMGYPAGLQMAQGGLQMTPGGALQMSQGRLQMTSNGLQMTPGGLQVAPGGGGLQMTHGGLQLTPGGGLQLAHFPMGMMAAPGGPSPIQQQQVQFMMGPSGAILMPRFMRPG